MTAVILYVRRSLDTDPPAAEALAPLRAWAMEAGHSIAGEYIDDSTEHGRVKAPRPKQDRATYDLMRGAADLLAVPTLATLATGIGDLRRRLAEFDAAGAGLYVHALGLDTTAPTSALFRQVLDALLAFDNEVRVEHAKRIHGRAKAKGIRIGGPRIAPSLEAKIESLLLAGAKPGRVQTLTHCGSGTITRVRKRLEAAGLMRPVPGRSSVPVPRP